MIVFLVKFEIKKVNTVLKTRELKMYLLIQPSRTKPDQTLNIVLSVVVVLKLCAFIFKLAFNFVYK